MTFLLFLSNIFFALFQYSDKTPNVNPNATPYPDTVVSKDWTVVLFWVAVIAFAGALAWVAVRAMNKKIKM